MVEILSLSANAFTLNGETLQRIYTVYINRAGDYTPIGDFKIFDLTFDKTFE